MGSLWNFIRLRGNRERLAWLGGGAVAVIGGLWTAFVYFIPVKHDTPGGPKIEANCGGIAIGRDVSNSTIRSGDVSNADCSKKTN